MIQISKTMALLLGSIFFLAGCSIGENPDTENFETQHQEDMSRIEEAEQQLFEDNQ